VLLRLTGLAEAFGWPARAPVVAESDRERVLAEWPGRPREAPTDIRPLRELAAGDFLDRLAGLHRPTHLVVGADFRCGRGRAAGVAELAPLCAARGIALVVVEPLLVAEAPASTSRVRSALASGDCAAAAACLGRPHRLVGTVVRGDGRGRGLGFPTANLGQPENLVPARGVYAAWARLGTQRIPAVLNIGVLPTVGAGRAETVEVHLLGWSGDCYGAPLAVDLALRLREERRFPSLDALRAQIADDAAAATAALSAAPAPR
jgi:riboflavin kinase/FMN adenylyltransferase